MYRLEDLNLGDKVTLDGGETGIVVCIMTDDYKDELDVFGNIVIRVCVCPHGMYPYIPSCDLDLMMVPEKREGWINIYNEGSNKRKSSITIYSTKEEAHLSRVGDCIDTVKIIWEE